MENKKLQKTLTPAELENYRIKWGLTPKQMYCILGVSRNTYVQWELSGNVPLYAVNHALDFDLLSNRQKFEVIAKRCV